MEAAMRLRRILERKHRKPEILFYGAGLVLMALSLLITAVILLGGLSFLFRYVLS